MNSGALQAQYLSRLSQAPDQLRQRVAYALSQIIVISMNKNIYPDEIVPYLQILSKDAFGNYRTLLGDISVSSQMGKYGGFQLTAGPLEANHDTRQEAFLGCTLPTNQTTTQDMNSLLDCLFSHPQRRAVYFDAPDSQPGH